jgi:aspartyl-tRNA(Asn)/glutamyl-tRNA(Gln) amidotransferase subunit A
VTIEEFGLSLRAGKIRSLEITEQCLARIASDNARLNPFICALPQEARRLAREADADLAAGLDRGPLHGVPVSIKDMFDVAGFPTTAASRVREGHVAVTDAAAISRLKRAGAVLVGKTNLHEFAFGTTNEDSAFGPTRNPYDPSRSPGGSSGGSAVSIVAGMALASLGTDTGGSIRIPAAACGIVGLKPTLGEIPTAGVIPLSVTMDHVGPLAQTVTDAWCVYHALTGGPPSPPLSPHSTSVLRLGVLRKYFCDILDDDVRSRFEESLVKLRDAGARIDDREIPHAAAIADTYRDISFHDAAVVHAHTLGTAADRYTPSVRERLEAARKAPAENYVRALATREVLGREVDAALKGYDALVLPTLPIPAPVLGASEVRIGSRTEQVRPMTLRLTQLFNLTGHPAVSLPCGRTAAGLPCGLQLVGSRMETDALLAVALAAERTL